MIQNTQDAVNAIIEEMEREYELLKVRNSSYTKVFAEGYLHGLNKAVKILKEEK